MLTLSHALAEAAMAWSDEEFLEELQRRFGFRLGRFLKVGRRAAYALSLSRARRTSAGRCIIIGNAAQGLHPVAGMGFNLALRDVASLAELIAEHGEDLDGLIALRRTMSGAPAIAAKSSRSPTRWCGCSPIRLGRCKALRNLGLLAFDLLPPAKAALSSLSARRGRAHSKARARRAARDLPRGPARRGDEPRLRRRDRRRRRGRFGHGGAAPGAPAGEPRQGGYCR